jgi:hypothetical protein
VKTMGQAVWAEEWSSKGKARSTGWVENSTIDKVIPHDLIFTKRRAIRKEFLTSFYRGLDGHITNGHVKCTAAPGKLFWWDEYQGVLKKSKAHEARVNAQWESDWATDSDESIDQDMPYIDALMESDDQDN